MSRYSWIIGIAQRIAQDECYNTADYIGEHYDPDIENIKRVYFLDGIRWNDLVEHDVNLVLSGYKPEYFLHWHEWTELYRENHCIFYTPPKGGTIKGDETIKLSRRISEDRENFIYELHCDSGWACPQEQAYFYKSSEWQRVAKAQRYIDGYYCRRCQRRNQELHVHHNSPIKSAYSYRLIDNFADWELTLYCKDCHEWFHRNFHRALLGNDFEYGTPTENEAAKRANRAFWKRYHDEKRCLFCLKHIGIHIRYTG